ncbi:MAG: DUF6624 domain-containing protein [Pseudomonadota bacterium]
MAPLTVTLSAQPQAEADPSQEAAYPEPPPLVAERIVDGRFEPGHFEYLRGFFPEASEEEKAQYAALVAWLKECNAMGQERLAAELTSLGLTLEDSRYTSAQASLCRQVFRGEQMRDRFKTYRELAEASREARLVFSTLVESIRLAELRMRSPQSDFARELEVRTLGEQLFRHSSNWSSGDGEGLRVPRMSEDAAIVFTALTLGEGGRVDRENTEWLKRQVGERGWPKLSDVGRAASRAAWLLAQHADHDPVFQYMALQMMEPLVAEGEVSKGDFAYLYDRINFKLKGKQRYGTQITCVDGEHAPHALEEPERLNELRAEMELNSIEEYLEWFRGSCGN